MPDMPTARIDDAEHRAPDVDPAGLDRGRPEEGADQRRQQIVETDIRLADAQLGGQHAAGEAGNQAGGDEHADDVGAHRNAVQRGRLLVGADRIDVAAERQPLADDPQQMARTIT